MKAKMGHIFLVHGQKGRGRRTGLFNKGSKTRVSIQNTPVLNLKGKTNMAQVKPIRVGQTIPKEAKQKKNPSA